MTPSTREPAVRLGSRSLCCRLGDPFVGFGGDCIGLQRGDFAVAEVAQLLQNEPSASVNAVTYPVTWSTWWPTRARAAATGCSSAPDALSIGAPSPAAAAVARRARQADPRLWAGSSQYSGGRPTPSFPRVPWAARIQGIGRCPLGGSALL